MFDQFDSPKSARGFRLELASVLNRWSVRVQPAEHAAVETLFGLVLPTEKLRAAESANGSALWLGPDEWLVLMPRQPGEAFRQRYASIDPHNTPHCSIVDVTHRNVGIRLSGAGAQSILNAGCPLDLSRLALPPGGCSRTLFGKAEIVLWRHAESYLEAPADYQIECWRSFLPYVWNKFQSAAAEYAADHRQEPVPLHA